MNIFCFVGSNYIHSLGAYIANAIQSKFIESSFDNYVTRNLKIQPCNGCEKGFDENMCLLDQQDDLKRISLWKGLTFLLLQHLIVNGKSNSYLI